MSVKFSVNLDVKSGAPRGSALETPLFLLLTDDPALSPKSYSHFVAGDVKVVGPSGSNAV